MLAFIKPLSSSLEKYLLAEYAQVLRMLGNGRLEAMCIDGVKRLCHIRGKMRKKVWVNTVSVCNPWDKRPLVAPP